jgi:regulator of sigma E protease
MTFVDLFHIGWTLLVALILFSVTVFVHELGHFLAARRKGLVVERFAIGMGPKLFGFKYKGVDYVFNALPIGGYVALPQMAPMEMVEGKNESPAASLPPITPWAKIVTAFWGPLFSFLLACVLAVGVWYFGKPDREAFQTTTIGYVQPDSPAAAAGLLPGDKIISIEGRPVTRWMGGSAGVLEGIIFSREEKISLEVERAGKGTKVFEIKPRLNQEMEGLRQIGISPMEPLVVERVLRNSPGQKAGLEAGDSIFAVDGQLVYSTEQVRQLILQSKGAVDLTVNRRGEIFKISLVPVIPTGSQIPMIGVQWQIGLPIMTHPLPWDQVIDAALLIKRTLGAIFDSKSDVGVKHLSGPVGIFDAIMRLLRYDPLQVLSFFVVLNVNLAILNILPIPILDGGHIVFSFVEMIRRKSLNPKIIQGLHLACFVFLISLFLFISFHDIRRFFGRMGGDGAPPPEIEFQAVE